MLYTTTGQQEQARTALTTAIAMYRADGHDILAPRDRGGAGAGERGMIMTGEAIEASP